MLSRVAHSIYWLGRYLERAENYARFIDVNFNLMQDLPSDLKEQWEPLVLITGDHPIFKAKHQSFDRKNVIHFLGLDKENPNSILSSVTKARENARIIRENLTKETWEKINELYHFVKKGIEKEIWEKDDPRKFFEEVKNRVILLYGLAEATIARTEGWYFRQLGLYLERADKTSRILDVKYHILLPSPEEVGTPLDFLHWMALLKSVTGFNTYRRLYGHIKPSNVVDFLALNKFFPRSIYFCLKEAEMCLHKISDSPENGYVNKAEKSLGSLRSKLEYGDVNDLINVGVHEYMDEIQKKLNRITNEVEANFFQIKENVTTQNQQQS